MPLKSQKNRRKYVRKILTEGGLIALIKALYHQKEYDKIKDFKYYLSVVLCVKDEADYILEWIEYNLLQGVDHFYVYNNNGTDNTEELLKPYIDKGIVTWHVYPGKSKQREIYNHAIKNYRFETRWMAFFDVDEFVVSPQHRTLKEILPDFEAYSQLSIVQITYGTSHHEHKTNDLVIERFTMHQTGVSRIVKSVVNPRKVIAMDVHIHSVLGESVDENKINLYGIYPKNPTANIVRINHYCVKSLEECMAKRNKGGSNTPASRYEDEWFKKANRNEETDDIISVYVPILKQKLGK